MASSEAMTSSTHSFAYSYRLVKKCFVKICETSKCHNFLIFQPIFIRFSLFCLNFFTLYSEINSNLFRITPLSNFQTIAMPYPLYHKNKAFEVKWNDLYNQTLLINLKIFLLLLVCPHMLWQVYYKINKCMRSTVSFSKTKLFAI